MVAYRAACVEFEEAEAQWDPYVTMTGPTDADSTGADAAFDRLTKANRERQDALDTLWVAWRNRPEPASGS